MTRANMRLIGIIFMLAAAILMILNLKRVADLGSRWLALPLFIIGVAFVVRSKKAML